MQKRAVKEKGGVAHNLQSEAGDLPAIEREFLDNSRYLKERKNGVVLFHEVLSFSPKDRDRLSLSAMHDLARRYMAMRAPEALGYAVVHDDTSSPHIHLMISGNILYSGKKVRLSKEEFAKIKGRLEAYQVATYRELTHSIAQRGTGIAPKKSRGEREQERRQRTSPSPTPTGKEAAALTVRACFGAVTLADFQTALEVEGMSLYERSGSTGVVIQRYRLSTLGLADEFAQAVARWQAIRERQEATIAVHAAKRRKEWRDAGFRGLIADVLLSPDEAPRRHRRRQRRSNGRGGNAR
jgi:hypothetical protein